MNATTTKPRVGPCMLDTLRIVAEHDGTFRGLRRLACIVGPHGSGAYGQRTIARCKSAGLVTIEPIPGDRYGASLITLTDAGREVYADYYARFDAAGEGE